MEIFVRFAKIGGTSGIGKGATAVAIKSVVTTVEPRLATVGLVCIELLGLVKAKRFWVIAIVVIALINWVIATIVAGVDMSVRSDFTVAIIPREAYCFA